MVQLSTELECKDRCNQVFFGIFLTTDYENLKCYEPDNCDVIGGTSCTRTSLVTSYDSPGLTGG